MRLLIDTHALIWYVDQDHLLSPASHAAISGPSSELLLSGVSIWEIAIKVSLKKLVLSLPYRAWIEKAIDDLRLTVLHITLDHADALLGLPFRHRDPFDRLIAAQAQVEGVPLVSADSVFDHYGITRVW